MKWRDMRKTMVYIVTYTEPEGKIVEGIYSNRNLANRVKEELIKDCNISEFAIEIDPTYMYDDTKD